MVRESVMRKTTSVLAIVMLVLAWASSAFAQQPSCSSMTTGQLTSLNGFVPFPPASLWNTDISAAPVDPNSANIISYIGSAITVHPDFGSGTYHSQTMGIPYQVVSGAQPKVTVKLGAYASESDPGPTPIPWNALIVGYPKPGTGDRHVLVLEKDGCWLYELYNATVKNGIWSAASSAIWGMAGNGQRPFTWTSADAAGLPIFPGLVRYDEVAAGAINNALRFMVPPTRPGGVPPAPPWGPRHSDRDDAP